jgi:hypothetical protein
MRLATTPSTALFCLLINGGPEEPAWRGFALPRLQQRFSPVKTTLALGTLWGLWHLPLLLIEDNVDNDLAALAFAGMLAWTLGGFIAYAFTYTYLWNRTQSAPLCMLLHASYNTAIGLLILRPADELVGGTYVAISLALTGTLWLVAVALVVATRGRLGLDSRGSPRSPVVVNDAQKSRLTAPSRPVELASGAPRERSQHSWAPAWPRTPSRFARDCFAQGQRRRSFALPTPEPS